MTTPAKVRELANHLAAADLAKLAPELAGVKEGIVILRGLGIDLPNPLDFILPSDPGEADVLIDKLIALLLELRGDDLPPFDRTRYGESMVAELVTIVGGEA